MPDDVSSLRALAHPVRLRILSLLTGTRMSAAEVARELGLTHANASYHLRVLAEAGELVEAGEERIRGGVAKRYRHPWDHARGPERGAPANQRGLELSVRSLAEEMQRRFRQRQPRTRSQVIDAELWISPQVWRRARALVEEAAVLMHADAQPPRTTGTVRVNMSAVLFEMEQG